MKTSPESQSKAAGADKSPVFMSVLGPVLSTRQQRLTVLQRRSKKKASNKLASFNSCSSVVAKGQTLAKSSPPLLQGGKRTSL